MIKRINGSWIEFHHLGIAEGKYFNPMTHNFTRKQWIAKVREMHELKMKYLVIMETANFDGIKYNEVYYPSKIYKQSKEIKCKDGIEVILSECDKLDMKVFISVGFYSNCFAAFIFNIIYKG